MNSTLKTVAAAAAIVAVVVVGINVLRRDGNGNAGQAAVSPSSGVVGSAALSPAALVSTPPLVSPPVEPSAGPQVVQLTVAGTELNTASLRLSVQLPVGWDPILYGAVRGTSAPPSGEAFIVSLVDNTFKDPCAHTQRTPKVGSSVAALATALGEIPNTTATKPVQTTLAGLAATSIELTLPASLPCAPDHFYLWQDSPNGNWWSQGLNERIQVWILEVAGQRVAIAGHSYPGTTAGARTELRGILDSVVFAGS